MPLGVQAVDRHVHVPLGAVDRLHGAFLDPGPGRNRAQYPVAVLAGAVRGAGKLMLRSGEPGPEGVFQVGEQLIRWHGEEPGRLTVHGPAPGRARSWFRTVSRPYYLVVLNRTVVRVLGAVALAAATVSSTAAAGATDGRHGGGAAGPTAAGPAAAGRSGSLRVGRLRVRQCAQRPLTFCGRMPVPLDYSSPASPEISIGFRWIPATRHAAGTVLAVEGGPGFATTGTEPQYLAMLGPLRRTRNLLLVNLRGTGNSTPVNCPGLEHGGRRQSGGHFNALVAACGRQLNHTWRYRGGGWVHASDLFNTAYSARDVAARHAGTERGQGRPLRRFVRKLVRPDLRVALPGANCGR